MYDVLLVLILLGGWVASFVSGLLSLGHALEETLGENGPLWDYVADRVRGRALPDTLGLLLLGVALPAALLAVAAMGYCFGSMVFLSLLAGARIGDSVFTHIVPGFLVPVPNPGVETACLYLGEAVLVLLYLGSALTAWAFLLGMLPFALLWPTAWVAARIWPAK